MLGSMIERWMSRNLKTLAGIVIWMLFHKTLHWFDIILDEKGKNFGDDDAERNSGTALPYLTSVFSIWTQGTAWNSTEQNPHTLWYITQVGEHQNGQAMVLFNTDPRNPLAGGSSSIPLPSTSFCSNHWLLAWADHKTTTKVVPQNIAKLTTTWPRCWLATHQSFWQLAHTLHIDHQTATLTLLQLGNNTIGIILKDSQTPDCRCILLSE